MPPKVRSPVGNQSRHEVTCTTDNEGRARHIVCAADSWAHIAHTHDSDDRLLAIHDVRVAMNGVLGPREAMSERRDDSTERRAGNYVCWVMSVVVHTAERYEHGDG